MKVETFFEKFELFAEAPGAVKRMRELIRRLAIRGLLVPQDHNDEPAVFLLDMIAAHKAAMANEGRLRGSTAVTPITHEGMRVLPSSWTWVKFGDVVINRDGERIPVSKENRVTKAKKYDYYGASGIIDKIDDYIFDKPLLLIGEDGANLINRSTPIAFMAHGQYWVNNHAHVIDGISEDFLHYLELHINAINLEPYITGSAQPKMNQAKMNSIPIALPPLAEQRRIVAKVDELMALCDRLEAQQQEREAKRAKIGHASLARFAEAPTPANLACLFHPSYDVTPSALRETILKLAVQGKLVPRDHNDEPADVTFQKLAKAAIEANTDQSPEHWLRVPLGVIGEWRGGGTPSKSRLEFWEGDLPWVSPKDMKILHISDAQDHISEAAVEDSSVKLIPPGSLLMVVRGMILARAFPVALTTRVVTINQDMKALLPSEPETKEYLLMALRALEADVLASIEHSSHGTCKLKTEFLQDLVVPIPPVAEQKRIVAKVDQLMALVDELEVKLATCRASAEKLLSAIANEITT